MKPTWTTELTNPTVATLRINAQPNKDWEQYVLFTSDRHIDNKHSNRKLQKKHLDIALKRNAPVIDIGDCFDAMQGKGDRRATKSSLRKENLEDDYFGSIRRSAVSFFEPYKSIMALWGTGNHESSVLKHHEVDLTREFVEDIQNLGSPIQHGGYRGWLRIMLSRPKGGRKSYILYYTHGSGGGGPVTKGVIQSNRRASQIDADIIIAGHIHEAWALEIPRASLTSNGNEIIRDQLHLSIPTYKEEYRAQGGGWHHETGKPPKPLGAWWLRFYYERTPGEGYKYEYIRAK